MKHTSALNRFLGKLQTFDALRYYRNFRFLLTSNFIYQVNWWMQLLTMGWLAYELTDSALLVAVFAAARLTPMLLGPFVGAIADRVNRRNLLITVRSLTIILASTLAILVITNHLTFWLLTVIGFLQGIIWSASYSASYSLTADIVGKEGITNAIALNMVAMNIPRIIGPLFGGALIIFLGPANCFWVAASLAGLAITTLFMVKIPGKITAAVPKSVLRDIAKGFKYVIHNRDMLSVLALTFIANIFYVPVVQAFMPIFAKDNFGLDAMGLGFIMATLGAGSLIGAFTIASLGNFKWKGLIYLCATGLTPVFLGAFALSRSLPLALVLIGLLGLAGSGFGTMQSTLTLILAPEDMRARSLGFLQLAIGVLPFGCLIMGAMSDAIGVSLATAIGCSITVTIVIVIAVVFPNLRRLY